MGERGGGLTRYVRAAWAKSAGDRQSWLPLTQHLADASDVALRLFDTWLAPSVRDQWGEAFPGSRDDARRAIAWLAGLHDVGKMSRAFAGQVNHLSEPMQAVGLELGAALGTGERRLVPHAAVSDVELRDWLIGHMGWDRPSARQVSSVLGAHHGKVADNEVLRHVRERPSLIGDGLWAKAREEIVEWMTRRVGLDVYLQEWAHLRLPMPVLVGMSGLVILADWIASSERYFPYRTLGDFSPPLSGLEEVDRVEDALAELAFPEAWAPEVSEADVDAFFRTRFGWDDARTVHRVQRRVCELARHRDLGMIIVETTTGAGKTEAALAAAELLAERLGLSGLYFALPTQATSNAMFSRVVEWLDNLPSPPPDVPAWTLTLAHGKAALNQEYRDLMESVEEFDHAELDRLTPRDVYDDEIGTQDTSDDGGTDSPDELSNIVAHEWFRGRKRALLASFSVGTIDQLLMAGLQSKHLMLRHLALSGKVVVIDEAHASDAYMDVYLDRVLSWLGAYGVPVIVLSATLPSQRRRSMIAAYAGRREYSPGFAEALEDVGKDERYPLITAVDRDLGALTADAVPADGEPRVVTWEWASAELDDLVTLVRTEAGVGGCVLVIRNTVGDAQRTARALREAGIGPVTLNHARFLSSDRAGKDAELLALFGPHGDRPERHILVATQVAEQSLDIDFDLLITDLAPMDLIFQRIGRLHRHARRRPVGLELPRCMILVEPESAQDAGTRRATRGTRRVYGDHLLLRTAASLEEAGQRLSIPEMVSHLVQQTFGLESVGPEESQSDMAAARKAYDRTRRRQRHRAKEFLLPDWDPSDEDQDLSTWTNLLGSDGSEQRGQAMARDIEPTLEVIVVPTDPSGATAILPPWQGLERPIDVRSVPDDDLARTIAGWMVRLPAGLTRSPEEIDGAIRWLQAQPAIRRWEWHRHPLLRGELFLPMKQLVEGGNVLVTRIPSEHGNWDLRYSPEDGLEAVRDV